METQEIASRSQGNPALLEGELLDFEDTEPAVASGTSKRRPDVPGEPSPKWTKRRVLLTAAVVAALAGGAYYGSYWWTVGRFLVSTDDAYVKADLSVISAKVAGNITAVPIKENAAVQAGDTLAQIDDRDYKIAVEAARNKLGTQEATIQRLKQQAVAQEARDRPGQGAGAVHEGEPRSRHGRFRPRANPRASRNSAASSGSTRRAPTAIRHRRR